MVVGWWQRWRWCHGGDVGGGHSGCGGDAPAL